MAPTSEPVQRAELVPAEITKTGQIKLTRIYLAHARRRDEKNAACIDFCRRRA